MTSQFTFGEVAALSLTNSFGMLAMRLSELFKGKDSKIKTPNFTIDCKDQQETLEIQFPRLKGDVIGQWYHERVVTTGEHVFATHDHTLFILSKDKKWQTFHYEDRTLIDVAVRIRNGKPRVIVLARNSAKEIIEAQTIDCNDDESQFEQFERSDFFRVPLEYKETVSDYCISEDGKYVLVKCRYDGLRETLTLGNLETRQVLFCQKFQEENHHDNCIHKIAFVENKRFAFAKGEKIFIYKIKKGIEEADQVISFEPNEKIVSFDAYGNKLAICWQIRKQDYSRKLCIFTKDRKRKYKFDQFVETCVEQPQFVYFTPNGKYLLISEGPVANSKEIVYDMTNMHDAFVPQVDCLHHPYRFACSLNNRCIVSAKERDDAFLLVDISERVKFYEESNCPKYTK